MKQTRRRRFVVRALVSLVAGVILTVAVAWVMHAVFYRAGWNLKYYAMARSKNQAYWAIHTQSYSLDAVTLRPLETSRRIALVEEGEAERPAPWWLKYPDDEALSESIFVIGLPMRCLAGRLWFESSDRPPAFGSWTSYGIHSFTGANGHVLVVDVLVGHPREWLPTTILWRGMIVNTLCFGVPVFLLLTLLPAARRGIRRRRGRCIWCNYSRAGLDEGAPCPECGEVVGRAR